MTEVRLQWLRPDEVLARQAEKSIVYLPIGPLEWHGPHLPLGTDPLQAESIALDLARRIGGVVHPTLYLGTERERSPELLRDVGFDGGEWIIGMDFPGNSLRSFYYPEDAFAMTVRFTLEQLAAHGFKLIVLLNGHGATNQVAQLRRLAAEFSQRGPARVLYTFDLDASIDDDAGHATMTETAAILALDPARVELNRLPPAGTPLRNTEWAIVDAETFGGQPTADHMVRPKADPRRATPELGHQHFAATIDRISKLIDEALADLETHPQSLGGSK
jgi:creatinine amidohydrolase